jgi:hypothetical protein
MVAELMSEISNEWLGEGGEVEWAPMIIIMMSVVMSEKGHSTSRQVNVRVL